MDNEDVAATMKDLREMQTSLTSLVDLRMNELHELLAQLASAKATDPSASSAPSDNSSEKVNVENNEEDEGEGGQTEGDEKDKDKVNSPKKNLSSNGKGNKEDFYVVPPCYSPDPPIRHPHINNIGVPPKIDATSSFSQWQYLMKSQLIQ